jgi:hypothetical protein
MRFFENIRIGRRLGTGFAIFIIIIALMALLGFKIIDDVDRKAGHIVEAAFEKTILANTVMGAIYDANNAMGVIAFSTDAAVIEGEKEKPWQDEADLWEGPREARDARARPEGKGAHSTIQGDSGEGEGLQ